MRRAWAVGLLACLLVATLTGAAAADERALVVDGVDLDRHPQVTLDVAAPDMSPADAGRAAFEVHEGGTLVDADVVAEQGGQQQVILLIDTSGSMAAGNVSATVREAATRFVDAMPDGTHVGLMSFATTTTVHLAPTPDHDAVRDEISGLLTAGRTALYDAVVEAIDEFDAAIDGPRFLVVLADGEDNQSTVEEAEAIVRLRASGVTLHGVELRTAVADLDALRALSESTGGSTHATDDADGLTDAYDAVARAIPARFTLGFESRGHGSTPVELVATAGDVTWTGRVTLDLPERPQGAFPVAPGPTDVSTTARMHPLVLVLGLALAWAAIATAYLAIVPPVMRVGLDRRGGPVRGRLVDRAAGLAESGLRHGPWADRFEDMLDRSGIRISAGQFLVRFAGLNVVVAFVGSALQGSGLAVVLLAVVAILTKVWLGWRADRRRTRFADQLEDTLQLLAGSLRAGHSLLQAVNSVADEAPEPTSREFRRIISSTRVGQDLSHALATTVERTGSDDFAWVAQAIAIHREVGGNLAEVLDTVASTIRDRNQIRRQVEALSAEGKLSAWVLMALPVGVVAFLGLVNPSYLARFGQSLVGLAMAGTAILMMTLGFLWLRRIVHIDF
ncbi:MAG: type II secretion system F family protein [Nitriliruptoraceae bacterium]